MDNVDDLVDDYDDEFDNIISRKIPSTKRYVKGLSVPVDEENLDEVGKSFHKLGKKIISYDKLTKRNVLDIRHLKKGNIFGCPTATVSSAFVGNINKLLKGESVSDVNMDNLNDTEKRLFHRMKHVAAIGSI